MPARRLVCVLTLVTFVSPLLCQEQPKAPRRDPMLLDVLSRVVTASGGSQALALVHDLTESGEITFNWGEGVKGPVTIQTLGSDHFRMQADLPEGKMTWVVRDGHGSRTEGQRTFPMTIESAINLENLTHPLSHVAAALSDAATDLSLVRIERRKGRSVYRLRLKGQLGLTGKPSQGVSIAKDILIDALSFDIVSIQDRPFSTSTFDGGLPDVLPREIEYDDFRLVHGVRVPFSVTTILCGQKTLNIRLNDVTFNSDLGGDAFTQ